MGIPNSLRAMHGAHKGKMTKGNMFFAELDLLKEEEGFNIGRDYEDPDVIQHIRNLADAYKAGETLPPLTVQVRDGEIYVREGHCRRRGALLARSEGAEISRLPLIESKGDDIDQTMILLTSHDGLKLKPVGRAKIYAKLINMGLTEEEVAKRNKKTVAHVQQYLQVHNMPLKMKDLINKEVVSWSMALDLYKEYGTKAVDILEAQIQDDDEVKPSAKSEDGQGTATNQDVPGTVKAKPKRITRKAIDEATGFRSRLTGGVVKNVTNQLGSIVKSLDAAEDEGDHIVMRISKEEAESIRSLHKTILPGSKSSGKTKHQDKSETTDVDAAQALAQAEEKLKDEGCDFSDRDKCIEVLQQKPLIAAYEAKYIGEGAVA
ncbi:hypothetical protein [Microbulbifer epialgicus]|uniref:ParB/Spo0J HTH domain-containing protein n=1 Tax=Microbulbifer epialgicus TaxID=393907 RepID=A0ABV4NTJ9_9GAMM